MLVPSANEWRDPPQINRTGVHISMSGVLAAVLSLALIDSVNPSAIIVTLYLLLTCPDSTSRVLAYLAGVFCTYFAVGVALMLGADTIIMIIGKSLESPVAYAAQGILGALMFLYGVFAPSKTSKSTRLPQSQRVGMLFLFGSTVTVVEFSTALPYLGAIGILTNADLVFNHWVLILTVYNLIFIMPPLLLLVSYRIWGARLDQRFAEYREKLSRGSRTVWLTILAVVGFVLLADSLRYFEFFGLVPMPPLPQGK